MIKFTPIGDNLEVGTRIHWDQKSQSLYYVDVPQSTIYKYKPATNTITKAKVGDEPLAFAFPIEGKEGSFIAGLGRKIVTLKWDGASSSVSDCNVITEVESEPKLSGNRFNGGKVDPYGRLWAGTMGGQNKNGETEPGRGSLYSLTKGTLKRHLGEIGISNGLAFDANRNKMYYVDTLFPGIYEYDYNGKNGEISNKKVIFELKNHNITKGLPDGLTIDKSGNLWLTVIFGSLILKIDPTNGALLEKVEMPTSEPTSLCFGNDDLNVLYVTTAKIPVNGHVPESPAGSTFKLENLGNNRGLPSDAYKI